MNTFVARVLATQDNIDPRDWYVVAQAEDGINLIELEAWELMGYNNAIEENIFEGVNENILQL